MAVIARLPLVPRGRAIEPAASARRLWPRVNRSCWIARAGRASFGALSRGWGPRSNARALRLPLHRHRRNFVRPGAEGALCQEAIVVLRPSSDFQADPGRQIEVLVLAVSPCAWPQGAASHFHAQGTGARSQNPLITTPMFGCEDCTYCDNFRTSTLLWDNLSSSTGRTPPRRLLGWLARTCCSYNIGAMKSAQAVAGIAQIVPNAGMHDRRARSAKSRLQRCKSCG